MEVDGKLILGAFGACMGMCLLFAGGGVALGAGIGSLLSSAGQGNASSILFVASVILFAISAFLFLKRNNTKGSSCCPEASAKSKDDKTER